jgi:hypothetical protein
MNPASTERSLPKAAAAPSPLMAAARLLLMGTALCLLVVASLVAFAVLVRDGNDYALVTRNKHGWLRADEAPKLVFVGGSNLAFGLDSELIERAVGRRVVNMGMNGYFGVRYMLEEAESALRPGDVIVLAFEYDSFVKLVEGAELDLFMVAKARPQNLAYMTWRERLGVLRSLPFTAQRKLMRLIRRSGSASVQAAGVREAEQVDTSKDMGAIETVSGFNTRGDLTSHFGVHWKHKREVGFDLTRLGLHPGFVPLVTDFAQRAESRGIKVLISYCPLLDSFHASHAAAVAEFHSVFEKAFGRRMISKPEDFVLPDPLFFDTVYHLTEEGRAIRSARLAAQLAPLVERKSAAVAH